MDGFTRVIDSGDAIDWFADALSRHPERAAALKETLRMQLDKTASRRIETDTEGDDGVEDLWDNVPV